MKSDHDQSTSCQPSDQQPRAPLHEEIGDRTPDEIEPGWDAQQGNEMRLPAAHHALCAQQVCQRSTLHQAVGQRACRRNHQAKEQGPLRDDRSSLLPAIQIRNSS